MIKPDGIHISTGAILPLVDPDAAEEVGQIYERASGGGNDEFDSKNKTGELTTVIMRALLKSGAGSRIEYATPGEAMRTPAPRAAKVPPNAPCPCGSGKKYKRCCGSY